MENTEIQNTGENPKPKSNKGLAILLIIIILALSAFIIVLISQKKDIVDQSAEVQQILEDQKQSLSKELNDMVGEYDALKGHNDSMNTLIDNQKLKIKHLLGENASNVQLITKYKKELGTLREVLKSYIAQVDSLNTRNQKLVQENTQVKTSLDQARTENVKISQEKDQLSTQVEKASVITAGNIVVTLLNKKGKDEEKLKNITKLRVCLTIRENKIAKTGSKDVFIRITRPDGAVITASEADVFEFQGQKIVYSAKRQVDYDGKDVDLCIYWDNNLQNNQLMVGDFTIDIFMDGNLIGTTKFTIKKKTGIFG
jgi:hypothetical protein